MAREASLLSALACPTTQTFVTDILETLALDLADQNPRQRMLPALLRGNDLCATIHVVQSEPTHEEDTTQLPAPFYVYPCI